MVKYQINVREDKRRFFATLINLLNVLKYSTRQSYQYKICVHPYLRSHVLVQREERCHKFSNGP